MNGEPEEENLNKSEISQVFEIALKRNLPVNFEVSRASWPFSRFRFLRLPVQLGLTPPLSPRC